MIGLRLGTLLVILLSFISCKEFIEPSIDNKKVLLLAPNDKNESNVYLKTFWWEEVPHSTHYQLQVVSPNFTTISRLVLDTIIKTNKFLYTLEPGNYEWQVRAFNYSSSSNYSRYSFIIHPATLEEQTVQTVLPADNIYVSDPQIGFKWQEVFGAKLYRIQIDDNDFIDEKDITKEAVVPESDFLYTIKDEQQYKWRVRGENDTGKTKWSAIKIFTHDKTPPSKVQLLSPLNKTIITQPAKLSWDAVVEPAIKYELFVYKSDSVSLFTGFPVVLEKNSYSFNLGNTSDDIVWKVRAIDKAGNKGDFSDVYLFSIK